MSHDRSPIPRDALPAGWGPDEVCDDFVSYCRRRPAIELIARQTEADRPYLVLGLSCCWELRYRHFVGEAPASGIIGRVSTRTAVQRGLLTCMRRINDYVEDAEGVFGVELALETVSLERAVPDGESSRLG